MRVLVCGGRRYDNKDKVAAILAAIKPTVIIQGGGTGADELAKIWAQRNNVPTVTYFPTWHFGRGGGPRRNQFMLEDGRPDLVVAFPGGAGTADMKHRARHAGVEVREI